MLIIDDRLTAHVLRGNYAWLPAGHDPADLATTTDWHYRLLTAILKPAPTGVHSTGFHELPEAERDRFLDRVHAPAPIVTLLDARLSLNTAATLKVSIGRISHLVAHTIAAAIIHDAAIAISIPNAVAVLAEACTT